MTFKVNFLCQKSFESFWFFFHWRISVLKKVFCYCHFLKTSIFEPLCFLKWCPIFDGLCEHLWKSNQKIIFILLIFLLKSTPCWLTSAKLHHWGHTNMYVSSYTIISLHCIVRIVVWTLLKNASFFAKVQIKIQSRSWLLYSSSLRTPFWRNFCSNIDSWEYKSPFGKLQTAITTTTSM